MNSLDVIILVITCYSIYTCIKKGFLRMISEFIAFVVASYAAYKWHNQLALFLSSHFHKENNFILIVSYIVIWIAVFFVINLIGLMLKKIFDKTFITTILTPLNIAASIFIGLLKGIFISSFIVIPLIISSLAYQPAKTYIEHSYVVSHISSSAINFIQKKILHKKYTPQQKPRGKSTGL
ncbi:MAG: hypothetical protein A2X42_10310 [Candidatus Margulisbacteria bacterium GWF2_38_17]|nr:MAG: hypothetical protein A2X42_10310 [Candidatus Margulisbacteria bacterium GWF2_38_17]